MSVMCCCESNKSAAPVRGFRRVGGYLQWALPVAGVALIPKCPACVAGYVLLASGISMSLQTANALRWTAMAVCVVSSGWLMVRAMRLNVSCR